MKSLAPFAVVFVVLILAAWGYASYDPITPAVVQARAETAAGPVVVDVLDQGLSLLFKFISAAGFASVLAFVWGEMRKRNALWWRENTTRRWRGGPNAQFQRQQSLPKLKREDLMLLALSGKRIPQVREERVRDDDTQVDLDF